MPFLGTESQGDLPTWSYSLFEASAEVVRSLYNGCWFSEHASGAVLSQQSRCASNRSAEAARGSAEGSAESSDGTLADGRVRKVGDASG